MHMYGHEYYGGNGIVGAQVSLPVIYLAVNISLFISMLLIIYSLSGSVRCRNCPCSPIQR